MYARGDKKSAKKRKKNPRNPTDIFHVDLIQANKRVYANHDELCQTEDGYVRDEDQENYS